MSPKDYRLPAASEPVATASGGSPIPTLRGWLTNKARNQQLGIRDQYLYVRGRLARAVLSHHSLLRRLIFIRRPVLIRLAGFKMYVRLDDMAVGAWIALGRSYEPHVTKAMHAFLGSGMVFVDIGANIGYYTLLAASRLGPEGKVIAFEPRRDNREMLRKSLHANDFRNVEIHPYAVSDTERIVGFDMRYSNSWITPSDSETCIFRVRAVTLDDFLRDEPRIDIIKMDIEGAEWQALIGMHQLIQRDRPIIFTEFHPSALETVSGIAPESYLSQLRDLGYEIFVVRTDGQGYTPHSNEEILEHLARSGGTHLDLLTYPAERTMSTREE